MSKESQQREKQAQQKLRLAATLRGLRNAYRDEDYLISELTAIFAKYKHPDAIPVHNRIIERIDTLCPDSHRLLKAVAGAIRSVINETQPT